MSSVDRSHVGQCQQSSTRLEASVVVGAVPEGSHQVSKVQHLIGGESRLNKSFESWERAPHLENLRLNETEEVLPVVAPPLHGQRTQKIAGSITSAEVFFTRNPERTQRPVPLSPQPIQIYVLTAHLTQTLQAAPKNSISCIKSGMSQNQLTKLTKKITHLQSSPFGAIKKEIPHFYKATATGFFFFFPPSHPISNPVSTHVLIPLPCHRPIH